MENELLTKGALRDDPLIRALGLEGDGTFAPCISALYSFSPQAQIRFCAVCGNFFTSDEPTERCVMCGAACAPTMPMLKRSDFAEVVEVPTHEGDATPSL